MQAEQADDTKIFVESPAVAMQLTVVMNSMADKADLSPSDRQDCSRSRFKSNSMQLSPIVTVKRLQGSG